MKEYMQEVHSITEFQELRKDHEVSVFTFSADWCPDCMFIKPFLPKLIEKYAAYSFYYVDRDQCSDVAIACGVMGIPSFVAFKDGVEINRFVSKLRKSEKEIDEFFASLGK